MQVSRSEYFWLAWRQHLLNSSPLRAPAPRARKAELEMTVWVSDLHLGRRTAAATQMIAQRKQSASPCGEYLEHMFSAACKHLWLQQADQQCSGYTFLAVGSRRLWHEASLTLLLLSEFITFISFMDHHFSNPEHRACRSQGGEMHGAHSRSWWEAAWLICFCCRSLQTCCPSHLHKVSPCTALSTSSGKNLWTSTQS